MTGQQDAEYRAGGPALARIFHHAAMIGHQLGDESKAKPASLWLAGDERLEQMIDDIGGRARSGIDHAHLDRERQPPPVDRKSTRLNSSHSCASRMPSSA